MPARREGYKAGILCTHLFHHGPGTAELRATTIRRSPHLEQQSGEYSRGVFHNSHCLSDWRLSRCHNGLMAWKFSCAAGAVVVSENSLVRNRRVWKEISCFVFYHMFFKLDVYVPIPHIRACWIWKFQICLVCHLRAVLRRVCHVKRSDRAHISSV